MGKTTEWIEIHFDGCKGCPAAAPEDTSEFAQRQCNGARFCLDAFTADATYCPRYGKYEKKGGTA